MGQSLLIKAIGTLGCEFMAVYGMTETAGTVISMGPADHDPGGPRAGPAPDDAKITRSVDDLPTRWRASRR